MLLVRQLLLQCNPQQRSLQIAPYILAVLPVEWEVLGTTQLLWLNRMSQRPLLRVRQCGIRPTLTAAMVRTSSTAASDHVDSLIARRCAERKRVYLIENVEAQAAPCYRLTAVDE